MMIKHMVLSDKQFLFLFFIFSFQQSPIQIFTLSLHDALPISRLVTCTDLCITLFCGCIAGFCLRRLISFFSLLFSAIVLDSFELFSILLFISTSELFNFSLI